MGGTPLLPLICLSRILKKIDEFGWSRSLLPGILPWLMLNLLASAAGEMMGYTFGPEQFQIEHLEADFYRHRFVSEEEARRIWAEELIDFSSMPVEPTIHR